MAVKFELPLTQTSTVVAFLCTLLVAVAFTSKLDLGGESLLGDILKFLHLGSFSAWLGVQVWVTFFAGKFSWSIEMATDQRLCVFTLGITMYRHLPRHTFGFIQGKLFPKYFLLGTILSSVTLLTYVIQNPLRAWEGQQRVQVRFVLLYMVWQRSYRWATKTRTKMVYLLHGARILWQ